MVIEFMKRGASPVKELITSKIKLSEIIAKGFDMLLKPGNNEIKMLVEPDE
jgi:threonine dehydrogenase-like Zn-dependent dehydrogenase